MINYEYPPVGGGAGNATQHIAEYLVRRGAEVAVISMQAPSLPPNEIRNGVTIYRVPCIRRRLNQSNILEMMTYIFSCSINFKKIFKNWKPDCAIAFLGLPGGAVGWWYRWRYKIPYIVSIRGGDVPGTQPEQLRYYHAIAKPFIKKIWHDACFVVANSTGLRDLAKQTMPDREILCIPNGVDTALFKPLPEKTFGSTSKLLFVGRLSYEKRVDLLLHSLSQLLHLDWRLTIVGDGPQSKTIDSLIENYRLATRVLRTGWLNKEDLVRHYQQSDVFVFPSSSEGMPNVVLEAMACGLPIVTTRIPGSMELVEHETNGLLVDANNLEQLTKALQLIMPDTALKKKFGEKSREKACRFSWDYVGRDYLALLQKCL